MDYQPYQLTPEADFDDALAHLTPPELIGVGLAFNQGATEPGPLQHWHEVLVSRIGREWAIREVEPVDDTADTPAVIVATAALSETELTIARTAAVEMLKQDAPSLRLRNLAVALLALLESEHRTRRTGLN